MGQFSTSSVAAPLPWQLTQWSQLSRALANDQLAHAYLLSGSEGLGKLLFAEAFVRYALCSEPVSQFTEETDGATACGSCVNCLKGGNGNHPDLLRIGPEEGSKGIKVDQIRHLSEFVIRSSHAGGVKMAIIVDAHLLNGNAANALLKTLEEPNRNTHVLLVSDHPGRLVATIRSRCQKLGFQAPSVDIAVPWLQGIIGEGNIASILEASDFRPLTALKLAEGDALQEREQFLQSICDVRSGRKSIQQVLSLSSKFGELEVLQYFSSFLAKLTKYSITGMQEGEEEPALVSMCSMLGKLEQRSLQQKVAGSLARFYTEVETARRQLASNTNPNPQLVMESILWRWSKLSLT